MMTPPLHASTAKPCALSQASGQVPTDGEILPSAYMTIPDMERFSPCLGLFCYPMDGLGLCLSGLRGIVPDRLPTAVIS